MVFNVLSQKITVNVIAEYRINVINGIVYA